jgi:hypothetical protein
VQSEVQHGEHSEEPNKREEISIEDLFVSELCDSGLSSPPYCPGSPCDLQKLLFYPPTMQEVSAFDVGAVMMRARKKYLGIDEVFHQVPTTAIQILVFPVEKNVSDDMFANDSMFDAVETVSEKPKTVAVTPVEEDGANFLLDFPDVSLELNTEQEKKTQEEMFPDEKTQEELFPNVSADMFSATFDLGSPIIEDDDIVVENPPLGVSVLSPSVPRPPPASTSSTPLPGHITRPPIGPDLTPVILRIPQTPGQTPVSVLSTPPPRANVTNKPPREQKVTDDIFEDDDELFEDEIFEAASFVPRKKVENGLFSASELVSFLNKSGSGSSREDKTGRSHLFLNGATKSLDISTKPINTSTKSLNASTKPLNVSTNLLNVPTKSLDGPGPGWQQARQISEQH